jgi:hypothetical protein
MKYIVVDNKLVDFSIFQQDLVSIWLEIDDEGKIKREIGFNDIGEIVHAFPSMVYKYGKYGIFDLNVFDCTNLIDDKSKIDFEKEWLKISN